MQIIVKIFILHLKNLIYQNFWRYQFVDIIVVVVIIIIIAIIIDLFQSGL